jgi:hypothetical protein
MPPSSLLGPDPSLYQFRSNTKLEQSKNQILSDYKLDKLLLKFVALAHQIKNSSSSLLP